MLVSTQSHYCLCVVKSTSIDVWVKCSDGGLLFKLQLMHFLVYVYLYFEMTYVSPHIIAY